MNKRLQLQNAAVLLKAWLKRKRARGIQPNSDQVWEHIQKKWPNFSEAEQEELFQKVP